MIFSHDAAGWLPITYCICVVVISISLMSFNTEEKYTWVLSPKDRTGDAGVHFLVLKPKVEPGVKSVNATVSIVTIAAQCKYWDEEESSWSEDGCRVSVT